MKSFCSGGKVSFNLDLSLTNIKFKQDLDLNFIKYRDNF